MKESDAMSLLLYRTLLCTLVFQVKDQQEAERKKMASQEIQQALEAQTKVIAEKQESVRNDLAQVEPAVIEAQQGNTCKPDLNICSYDTT